METIRVESFAIVKAFIENYLGAFLLFVIQKNRMGGEKITYLVTHMSMETRDEMIPLNNFGGFLMSQIMAF